MTSAEASRLLGWHCLPLGTCWEVLLHLGEGNIYQHKMKQAEPFCFSLMEKWKFKVKK